MSQYYLMSQLPSLDCLADSAPLPITEERFDELCGRLLNQRMIRGLNCLTLSPSRENESTGYPLINAWNAGERRLRMALATVREQKMKRTTDDSRQDYPPRIWEVARTAVQMTDPLAAEQYLSRYRLEFLETLRPMDGFSDEAVFYYGLKLKLLGRMRAFDAEKGARAYQKMYNSILHNELQEDTQ